MIKKFTLLLWLAIPLLSMAQLQVQYEYDAAGNRTIRKTIMLAPQYAPPDSTETKLQASEELEPQISATSSAPLKDSNYFIEKIAQVEIKIYPNPTTEKITLEILNWQNLQTGTFKLYSLTGQLLQEQPVHSESTIISLANLPKGTYILKVFINNRTEDWKVIKQ
jgi:hypothetical protein